MNQNRHTSTTGNNFYCDYFLTGKIKIVTFDTRKANFSLMFQTMKGQKCTKSHQYFQKFSGLYPDPHFVL